ncbi:MAG: alginate O-acetyltransferase AlgX-related protein [Chlorobiota bacterium]
MKKFLINITLFSLPILLLFSEAFLPVEFFSYRPWEALMYSHSDYLVPYYPNADLTMESEGDLCHHTANAIAKNERWVTDSMGYRNSQFISNPDILIIGDSFIVGSSLTQDSTLGNVLNRLYRHDKLIYTMSPSPFIDFVRIINSGKIEKPKTVIFSNVERSIPKPLDKSQYDDAVHNPSEISIFKDKATRMYSLNYLYARITGKNGPGIAGINGEMFFLNGENQEYLYDRIEEVCDNILTYKQYCDSIGVEFIYMPMPNKETVYYELVPLDEQPNYINQLTEMLTKKGVNVINTLEIFNTEREQSKQLLYQLDDTHWNSNGVKVIANEIRKTVN